MLCLLVLAALLVSMPAVAAMLLHMPTTWACVHYLGFAGAGWAVITMRNVHLLLTAGEPAFEQPSVLREQRLIVFRLCWNGLHRRPEVSPWDAIARKGRCSTSLAALELHVHIVVIQCACTWPVPWQQHEHSQGCCWGFWSQVFHKAVHLCSVAGDSRPALHLVDRSRRHT